MASVSVSHLILFIASMVVAASVAGTVTSGVNDVSQSLEMQSVDVAKQVRTDVSVISDAGAPVYNVNGNENVTLLVKNTGDQTIPVDASVVDVILDGTFRTQVSLAVAGSPGQGTWHPGEVVTLSIHAPGLQAGDHRVKLVVNGNSEVFRFRT